MIDHRLPRTDENMSQTCIKQDVSHHGLAVRREALTLFEQMVVIAMSAVLTSMAHVANPAARHPVRPRLDLDAELDVVAQHRRGCVGVDRRVAPRARSQQRHQRRPHQRPGCRHPAPRPPQRHGWRQAPLRAELRGVVGRDRHDPWR